jgi:plasmid stabilization system protein ParE
LSKNIVEKMVEIIFSETSIHSYEEIYNFLLSSWNLQIANTFHKLVLEKIKMIEKSPSFFGYFHNEKQIRRAIIHRNASMLYYFNQEFNQVEILYFYDNRQNSERIQL